MSDPHAASRRGDLALIACVAGFASVFVLLMLVVRLWPGAHPLDRFVHGLPSSWMQWSAAGPLLHAGEAARAAVVIGSPIGVAFAVVSLAGLALVWRDAYGFFVAVLGPALAGALTEFVAKPLIGRRGPTGSLLFPSGHAAGVTAVVIVALVLVHRRLGWAAAMTCLPFGVVVVVLVGAGLVSRRYHYVTDVAGGVALAGAVVAGLAWVMSHAECRAGDPGGLERSCQ